MEGIFPSTFRGSTISQHLVSNFWPPEPPGKYTPAVLMHLVLDASHNNPGCTMDDPLPGSCFTASGQPHHQHLAYCSCFQFPLYF